MEHASQRLLQPITFTQVRLVKGAELLHHQDRSTHNLVNAFSLKDLPENEGKKREKGNPSKVGSRGKMESLLLEAWLRYLKYLQFSLSYICKNKTKQNMDLSFTFSNAVKKYLPGTQSLPGTRDTKYCLLFPRAFSLWRCLEIPASRPCQPLPLLTSTAGWQVAIIYATTHSRVTAVSDG